MRKILRLAVLVGAILSGATIAADYFTASGNPSTGAALSSSVMRSEFSSIAAGFVKVAPYTGNGSKIVAINSGGTAQEAITTTGTGSGVRATSPTLVTPILGVATATSINGNTITTGTGALTLGAGSTLATSATNSITLTSTGATNVTLPTTGTLAILGANTFTAKQTTVATAAVAGAGFNLPHGTVPDTPANGDVWTTTAGIYVRVNGVTAGPLGNAAGDHIVTVHSGNGHGSTNTMIRRFTTLMTNTGTAITYADSAANGASFTINEAGLYEIFYRDYGTANTNVGVSVNSAELTTAVQSILVATWLGGVKTMAVGGEAPTSITRVVKLAVSDVIRPHTDSNPSGTDSRNSFFSIRKVGS